MNDTRIFRKINTIETNIITKSLNNISVKFSSKIDSLKEFLYVSIEKSTTEKEFPKIYLITYEQMKFINKIIFKRSIYGAGLYFGFIKKGNFYMSIEGVEYLYKQKIISEFQRIEVNELGEKSILYGNNILKKMVIKTPVRIKKNGFLVVFNENGEIIAIARSSVNNKVLQELSAKEIIAMNLSDKGFYLRKKQ